MHKFVAGIVSYNPDIDVLLKNISAVYTQVENVIVVDNGSNNIQSIEQKCCLDRVILIKNNNNEGIAKALNQIFEKSIQLYGYDIYVLTLDQDSIVYSDIISVYKNYINFEGVASISSLRYDRNYPVEEKYNDSEYEYIRKCITSGNLVYARIWNEIGGFNEDLFIDMVDTEFCYRLIENGYKILRVNKVELEHELGKPFRVRFLGRIRTILNHSAFRRYYIFRNTIYVLRKYKIAKKDYSYWGLFKSLFGIIFYEDDKKNKLVRSFKGISAGFKMKV